MYKGGNGVLRLPVYNLVKIGKMDSVNNCTHLTLQPREPLKYVLLGFEYIIPADQHFYPWRRLIQKKRHPGMEWRLELNMIRVENLVIRLYKF